MTEMISSNREQLIQSWKGQGAPFFLFMSLSDQKFLLLNPDKVGKKSIFQSTLKNSQRVKLLSRCFLVSNMITIKPVHVSICSWILRHLLLLILGQVHPSSSWVWFCSSTLLFVYLCDSDVGMFSGDDWLLLSTSRSIPCTIVISFLSQFKAESTFNLIATSLLVNCLY